MASPDIFDEDSLTWVHKAAIADLTDNSGGTADSTLADVEATYTEATLANNFADLAAKINLILAALRSANIIAGD